MSSNTPNFNFITPTVGSDDDVWGDYLDTNWTSIDSLLRRSLNNFINSTAPSEAQPGTIWLDNTSNPFVLKIYDGTDWIIMGYMNTTTNAFTAPTSSNYIGDYKFSTQAANHGSWLLCNGASVSTTTYSGLFALIGYAFGGSGANFTLPDLRGQVPGAIGTGSYSGASARTLGQFTGSETHTLTQAQLPDYLIQGSVEVGNNEGREVRASLSGTGNSYYDVRSGGSGQSHNNMQPTLFVGNYFIYTGV